MSDNTTTQLPRKIRIPKILGELTEAHKEPTVKLIKANLKDGKTMRWIGEALEISPQAVHQVYLGGNKQ